MQVPPSDRAINFRPTGAEQLSGAAQAQAVATVRPQPISETDTSGAEQNPAGRDRTGTDTLVRLSSQRSDEATYDRQLLAARRQAEQSLDQRIEQGRQEQRADGIEASAQVTTVQPPSPGTSPAPTNSAASRGVAAVAPVIDRSGAAQEKVDFVRNLSTQRGAPIEPESSAPAGAQAQTTPSSEPLGTALRRPPLTDSSPAQTG